MIGPVLHLLRRRERARVGIYERQTDRQTGEEGNEREPKTRCGLMDSRKALKNCAHSSNPPPPPPLLFSLRLAARSDRPWNIFGASTKCTHETRRWGKWVEKKKIFLFFFFFTSIFTTQVMLGLLFSSLSRSFESSASFHDPRLSLSLSFRAATRMDAAGRWCGGPYSLVSPPLFYTPHVLSCLYRYLFPVGVFCTPSSRRGVFRASDAFFFLVISPKREVVCKFPKMTTQYITDKGEGGSSFTPTAALRKIALCLTALSFVTKQPARPAAVHFPFIPLKKKKSEKMMISILYTISRYRFDAS